MDKIILLQAEIDEDLLNDGKINYGILGDDMLTDDERNIIFSLLDKATDIIIKAITRD